MGFLLWRLPGFPSRGSPTQAPPPQKVAPLLTQAPPKMDPFLVTFGSRVFGETQIVILHSIWGFANGIPHTTQDMEPYAKGEQRYG